MSLPTNCSAGNRNTRHMPLSRGGVVALVWARLRVAHVHRNHQVPALTECQLRLVAEQMPDLCFIHRLDFWALCVRQVIVHGECVARLAEIARKQHFHVVVSTCIGKEMLEGQCMQTSDDSKPILSGANRAQGHAGVCSEDNRSWVVYLPTQVSAPASLASGRIQTIHPQCSHYIGRSCCLTPYVPLGILNHCPDSGVPDRPGACREIIVNLGAPG